MTAPRQKCILIFRLGSIGDTVVALPCFHAIARRFAKHRRVLLTNALLSARASSAESVLDGSGLIDEVIYFPVRDAGIRHALALAREVQRLAPSALVYLTDRSSRVSVFRDSVFFRVAGIRRLIGIPWTHRLRECAINPVTHELEYETERLARLLGKIMPVSLSLPNWQLSLSASELAKAELILGEIRTSHRLVAIAPGAKIAAKDWGANNWALLLRSLATQYAHVALVIVGAMDERPLAENLGRQWAGPVVNLCGALTPRETAAVLRQCEFIVCHDSGPMHLAASQQIPCLALFGNYNKPRRWYPYGRGHRVIHEPRGLGYISVQRVANEIRWAMQGTVHRVAIASAAG
jgi:heptosyltransferase-3